jgi:hypothetical protein
MRSSSSSSSSSFTRAKRNSAQRTTQHSAAPHRVPRDAALDQSIARPHAHALQPQHSRSYHGARPAAGSPPLET